MIRDRAGAGATAFVAETNINEDTSREMDETREQRAT